MLDIKEDLVGYLWSLCGFYGLGAEESDNRYEHENGGDSPKHDSEKERNMMKPKNGRGEVDL